MMMKEKIKLDLPEMKELDEIYEISDKKMEENFSTLNMTTQDINFVELDDMINKILEYSTLSVKLKEGVNMVEYAKECRKGLSVAAVESLEAFVATAEVFAILNCKIEDCDEVLSDMDTMLSRFQGDLNSISSEIKSLQDQSLSLSLRLKNRKQARDLTDRLVDSLSISKELMDVIMADDDTNLDAEF